MGAGYSVSAITDVVGDTVDMLWVKTRLTDGEPATMPRDLFGATAATKKLHLTRGNDPNLLHPAARRAGCLVRPAPPLPARIHAEQRSGDPVGVPDGSGPCPGRNRGGSRPRQDDRTLVRSAEIRTVAADEFWLSSAYRRDSFGIHFTWRPEPQAVAEVVDRIEDAIAPFDPRPHWGKVFGERLDIAGSYPRLADFRALAERYDPTGVFRNTFLARTIGR